MKAALTRKQLPGAPNLGKWLHHVNTAVFRLEQEGPLDSNLSVHDQLSQLNVLVQLEHVSSYPIVRERTAAGTLQLSGWWFDVASGNMYVYERATRSFEVLDRREADRLLARLDDKEGTGQTERRQSREEQPRG
jgi:carbonic anhydrase